MSKQEIIEKTLEAMNRLPEEKVAEVFDFAEFILKKYEEFLLNEGIQELTSKSKTYEFLEKEEEIYSVNDLKVIYNAKR